MASGLPSPPKRPTDEIVALDRAKSRALIGLLNDLRTPLMMIKSPLRSNTAVTPDDKAQLLENADTIQSGIERALRILEMDLWSDAPANGRAVESIAVNGRTVEGPAGDGQAVGCSENPTNDSSAASSTDRDLNGSMGEDTKETTVLIVDDHIETRAYLRYALKKHHAVIEASNGKEALDLVREVGPDLVVSDIMMPIMDGTELCRLIKSDDSISHIPVFLVTANGVESVKTEGFESGADDYLIKPFDVQEAVMRINNEIKARGQLRRRYSREVVIKPSDITVTPEDEAFLERARTAVEEHMGDSTFTVQDLASEVGLSSRQLQRRLREIADQSPVEFIRLLRLQRAAQLLDGQYGNVSEVAYAVGFTSLSYFAKCFKEEYGESPSNYKEHVEG